MHYERILAAVEGMPWAIEPDKGRVVAEILSRRIAQPVALEDDAGDFFRELHAAEMARREKSRTKARRNGVGFITLYGVMCQRAEWFTEMSGMTSCETMGKHIDEAVADEGIETIVIDVDSPGGSVFGVEELARKVAGAKKAKRVIAVANAMAASAAYYVASQAGELVVTPSGMVGSIGVYQMHVDRSEEMRQMGRTVTFVSAGERKTAGHEYGPLEGDARKEYEEMVAGYYDQFVKAVARGRNVSQARVKEGFGRGGMMLADAAVKEGMADRVASLEDVLARYGVTLSEVALSAQLHADTWATRGGGDFEIELRKRKLQLSLGDLSERRETNTAIGPTVTPELRRIAHHEAAHAVAAYVLGARVISATIVPDGKNLGLVTHECVQGAVNNAAVALAGRFGECLIGEPKYSGSEVDEANAAKSCPVTFLPEARQKARDIVHQNAPAIKAVAAELLTKKTITGDAVRAAVHRG
jgi:signal peptide peptidase SppA